MPYPAARQRALHRGVSVEPAKDLCDAPLCQRDAGISGAVVQIDAVAVCIEGVPARERDVSDVALSLVGGLGPEDPRVTAQRTLFGRLQIEQGRPKPVVFTVRFLMKTAHCLCPWREDRDTTRGGSDEWSAGYNGLRT